MSAAALVNRWSVVVSDGGARALRSPNVTIWDAVKARDQLRSEGRDRIAGTIRSTPLWSDYAVSLLEAKVAEGKLKSSKSRERWGNVLKRLLRVFGRLHVDELRVADIVAWRDQVARWMRDGMPSTRKSDEGKSKLVKLSPVTANGWISILKVICAAMTKHYELVRDPSKPIEYFPTVRTYTREQPNALTGAQMPLFLAKMKERHPEHYAMAFLGFVIGARPSTLRPLRRSGREADVLWNESMVLLRRSNPAGDEIMDQTKTGLDQDIPLPSAAMRVLREHVAALPRGPMRESESSSRRRRAGCGRGLRSISRSATCSRRSGGPCASRPAACAARSKTWRARPTCTTS